MALTESDDTSYDSAISGNTLTRQFNCALNSDKQLKKIVDDAHLPNFKTEVNNSGYNVNIRCNSGTYAKVVKPTLFTISEGYSVAVGDWI